MPKIPIIFEDEPDEQEEFEEFERKARIAIRGRRTWPAEVRKRYTKFLLWVRRKDKLLAEGFSDTEARLYMRRKIGGWKLRRLRKRRLALMRRLPREKARLLLEQMSKYFYKRVYEKKGEPEFWSPDLDNLVRVEEYWEDAARGELVERQ